MSDETVTKWRCSRCQRTFEDPYEADQHDHESGPHTIREIEVEPTPEPEPTSLSDWGFESARDRRDQGPEADR